MNDSRHELSAPPDLGGLADELVAQMMDISKRVSREVHGACCADLTPPQFLIMRNLIDGSGDCMSDLADLGRVPPSAITAMVDRLEARGFVERVRDDADRRVVHVRATKEGAAEYRKVRNAIRKQVRRLLAVLEPDEVATLAGVFAKLSAFTASDVASAPAFAASDGKGAP